MPLHIGRRRLRAALGTGRNGSWTPHVAIIGAGLSGLGAAIELRRAGLRDITIFEKAGEVGGTWRDNTYPGSGCDVPSHLYSFSFAPKVDWTRKFAEQPEILGYARALADDFGLRPLIRFSTEIVSASFDDRSGRWRLTTGEGEDVDCDVLIGAVGQLNRPAVPALPGASEFAGATFHSARWDHSVDLADKHVAVVGNGASAIQFVPAIAGDVASLTIFQRSSNYVAPKPDRVYGTFERRLLRWIAPLQRAYRWRIYWALELRWLLFRRESRLAALAQRRFSSEIRTHLVSDRLTDEMLVPDYPIGCKRILISNDWYPALLRPTTQVVTSPVDHLTSAAVVSADGVSHRADVVIFATGFDTTHFLAPIEVTGSNGRQLDECWRDGAEAYLGITVAGFPNLFLLYGPNTNLGHNSILFMVERQIDYVAQCIARMVRRRANVLEVRGEAMTRFNGAVSARLAKTAWAGACHSWYKTAQGRVTNNWPGFTLRYWADTLVPRFGDFHLSSSSSDRQPSTNGSAGAVTSQTAVGAP